MNQRLSSRQLELPEIGFRLVYNEMHLVMDRGIATISLFSDSQSVWDKTKTQKLGVSLATGVFPGNPFGAAVASCSLSNQLLQLPIAIDYFVFDLVGCDFGEELAGTFNSTFFDFSQLHAGYDALGFGNEIDVFHLALLEGNRPVGVLVANRCGYE